MPYQTVNGHAVHYLDTKDLDHEVDNSKPTIVMIHGLGSSQNYYMPVIPYLQGHRCIALSTYGAAVSRSEGEKLSLEQLAEDVVAIMDGLTVPKAIIVGHSMGGPMALTVAAKHPDRVVGVVAIGPVNPTSVKAEIFETRIKTVLKDGMEPLADSIPRSATAKSSTTLQKAMIRELLLNQEPKSYASHCDVIVNMRDPGFESIKAPVLIIAGDEDKSAPLEGCQYILDHLGSPNKTLNILTEVGHWHCIEAPEEVGREILAFAAKLLY